MSMDIIISNNTDTPIYMQIYEQISAQIIKGELTDDYCLPPIRTIAKELRISVIPVKRAWEELEREHFIYTIAGKGCFVSPHKAQELDIKRNSMAEEKMMKDIEYYRSLGLSLNEILKLAEECYKKE